MARYYSATAQDNQLAVNITNSSTSFTVSSSLVGYPTLYPYTIAVDFGNNQEELMDVTSVVGLTLNVTRGINGTSAVAHYAGAAIRHVITARDLTDAQSHYAAGPAGVHNIPTAVGTFLATPSSSNLLAAMTDETGTGALVFANSPTINTPVVNSGVSTPTFTSNSYTLALSDNGKVLLAGNSGTNLRIYVPTNASVAFPVGATITIILKDYSVSDIWAVDSGTTSISSVGANPVRPKFRTQYSAITLIKAGTDIWYAMGDIV